MLDNIVENNDFALLMQKHIEELIIFFFEKEQNFGVLCKIEDVEFDPVLPDSIVNEFHHMTLFFLAGYTFETAHIDDDCLVFEAGFGRENIGSVVRVPLISIMQIIVNETPLLINLATVKPQKEISKDEIDDKGVQNSMASFLSNPENLKFLKNKQ